MFIFNKFISIYENSSVWNILLKGRLNRKFGIYVPKFSQITYNILILHIELFCCYPISFYNILYLIANKQNLQKNNNL